MIEIPVFKVKLLKGYNDVETTIVFAGRTENNNNSEQELNEGNVIYADSYIHLDDTIETVKVKILLAIKKERVITNLNHLYLFCQKKEEITTVSAVQSITNGDTTLKSYDKSRYINFFKNIDKYCAEDQCDEFQFNANEDDQNQFNYNSILDMRLDHKTYIVDDTLGKSSKYTTSEILVCNPYKNTLNRDNNNDNNSANIDDKMNDYIVLDSGPIVNNTIFACFKKNDNEFGGESSDNSYFLPIERKVTDAMKQNIQQMDKYYKVFNENRQNVDHDLINIKEVVLTILPKENSIVLPVEDLFKVVHATNHFPFVMLKLGEETKICRLYTDNETEDGEKIPAMYDKRPVLEEATRGFLKNESCLFIVQYEEDNKEKYIFCQFTSKCEIKVKCLFEDQRKDTIVDENRLFLLLKKHVNPLIEYVSSIFEHTGYSFRKLDDSLRDPWVKINKMTLEFPFQKGKNMKQILSKNQLLFYKTTENNMTSFFYKRVSRYDADACPKYQSMKKKTSIVPCFLAELESEAIKIVNINNIYYLDTIPVYMSVITKLDLFKGGARYINNILVSDSDDEDDDDDEDKDNNNGDNGDNGNVKVSNNSDNLSLQSKSSSDDSLSLQSSKSSVSSNSNISSASSVSSVSSIADVEPDVLSDANNEQPLEPPKIQEESLKVQERNIGVEEPSSSDISMINSRSSSSSVSSTVTPQQQQEQEQEEEPLQQLQLTAEELERIEERKAYLRIKDKKINNFKKTIDEVNRANNPNISTKCQVNKRPIVKLDEDEKNTLLQRDKFYEDKILSTNENEYYVCPKFYSILTNEVVPENEIQVDRTTGEKYHPVHGKIITDKKNYQEGHYLIQRDKKENTFYPGYQDDHICCFTTKNKSTKQQQKNEEANKVPANYVLQFNYDPVKNNQLQELPDVLKSLFPENFFIRGVEKSKNQSFISCLAFVETYEGENSTIKSIDEMKQALIERLTLDDFVSYQNGNLVTNFQDTKTALKKCQEKFNEQLLSHDVTSSQLYNKLDMNNIYDKLYLQLVLSAYANFVDFVMDKNSYLDYTYLWDLVTDQLKLNLVVFEVMDGDNKNVHLVCPTNHFVTSNYNPNHQTVFLLKKLRRKDTSNEVFFEPLLKYDKLQLKIQIKFKENSDALNKKPDLFPLIINTFEQCHSKTVSTEYEQRQFKQPILLDMLLSLLKKSPSFISTSLTQIVSYDNKVIGVRIGNEGFLPCYPSSINKMYNDVPYEFITDSPSFFQTYDKTFRFLERMSTESNSIIPCKPKYALVNNDENVVGIITESNQFVETTDDASQYDPIQHKIEMLKDHSYLLTPESTVPLLLSNKVDKERIDLTNAYKLENNFYSAFKSTVKYLLNQNSDNENSSDGVLSNIVVNRMELQDTLNNLAMVYTTKMKKVVGILKELVDNHVSFALDTDALDLDLLLQEDNGNCISKEKEKCNNTPSCQFIQNNDISSSTSHCQLIVPERNLITGKQNETVYYNKLADELIRYPQSRTYIFSPQIILTVANNPTQDFLLRENEIIKLYSELSPDYFRRLVPVIKSKYKAFNAYDEINPLRPMMNGGSHQGKKKMTKKKHSKYHYEYDKRQKGQRKTRRKRNHK